eukprot:CAMPEP_0115828316 /NCGR_PEP_ID=MMETSP0287-20121206/507_1 /TAXON_ID=412157 /ORGANISM="Chrysochromulina rotalis, Strain UIO044" /LENGTH=493 /DNA_ID=CAMNT_0003281521 /DNA_START=1 /DNA_END=1482 /DNA_ORIENTATION=+
MDISCAHFVGPHGMAALEQGLINESLIDLRLANLFRVRMRLQHFDPPGPLQSITPSALCTIQAAEVAREGTRQGSVLIKNTVRTLPLSTSLIRSVAVIGPNAYLSKDVAGYYGSEAVCGGAYPTMVDAIASAVPKAQVHHAAGVPSVLSDDTSGISDAAGLAASADVTVLVLGTDLTVARENLDAVNLTFSAGQLSLVYAVAAASPTPVVAVILSAVPLDVSPLLAHRNVGAILHAGQPSIQTMGIVDVLFGVISPAGRAVQTVYPEAYQHQISPFDFNMRPGASAWPRPDSPGPCSDPNPAPAGQPQPPAVKPSPNCTLGSNPGRTYRFFNGTSILPFGFGLSYTTFTYNIVSSPKSPIKLDRLAELLHNSRLATGTEFPRLADVGVAAAECVVNVTNTGDRDSDDVVMGFIAPPGGGTDGLALKSLFGFERVHVKAGQTVSVALYPPLASFAVVTSEGIRRALPGIYKLTFGIEETSRRGMGFTTAALHAT